MSDIARLLTVVDAYCQATGLSESRVSTLFLKSGARSAALRAGGDMGSRTIAKAIEAFSDAWPGDAAWPSVVPRPSRAPDVAPGAQPDATGGAVSSSPVASFLSGDAA